MKIILDAFGGDNAPLAPLQGARMAVDELGVEILLVGDREKLEAAARTHQVALDGMELVHAPLVMPINEEAGEILKSYRESSMAVGLRLLAEGRGDALVSAGSTAALVMGSTMIVKRMRGVKRAAIGTVVPCAGGSYLLIDAGANHECRPEMLVQFAIMGSVYMKRVAGIQDPKVGLVNIGAEEHKGPEDIRAAYEKLKAAPVHFAGNVEPRDIPLGACDVVVCDGFTGNVILKLSEGLAKFLTAELKGMFLSSTKTKVGALLLKDQMARFKKKLDYAEQGGAPLLGIAKPVIKAHGSSNEVAIKNAVRQAMLCCKNHVVEEIEEGIREVKESGQPGRENQ